jgi:hypothetical protein
MSNGHAAWLLQAVADRISLVISRPVILRHHNVNQLFDAEDTVFLTASSQRGTVSRELGSSLRARVYWPRHKRRQTATQHV